MSHQVIQADPSFGLGSQKVFEDYEQESYVALIAAIEQQESLPLQVSEQLFITVSLDFTSRKLALGW